jgi:hypothetical protein
LLLAAIFDFDDFGWVLSLCRFHFVLVGYIHSFIIQNRVSSWPVQFYLWTALTKLLMFVFLEGEICYCDTAIVVVSLFWQSQRGLRYCRTSNMDTLLFWHNSYFYHLLYLYLCRIGLKCPSASYPHIRTDSEQRTHSHPIRCCRRCLLLAPPPALPAACPRPHEQKHVAGAPIRRRRRCLLLAPPPALPACAATALACCLPSPPTSRSMSEAPPQPLPACPPTWPPQVLSRSVLI